MMTALIVPRFRNSSRRPINSIKHIIDSFGNLSGAAPSVNDIVVAVPNVDPAVFNPLNVRVGATVNAFFLSVFVIGATGAPLNGPIDWYLIKTHTSQTSLPPAGGTGTSSLRNQIIHEEKGLAGSGDGTPMAFKGVIVIPRGMRRMREGDKWTILIKSEDATSDGQFCIKAIYKSFY